MSAVDDMILNYKIIRARLMGVPYTPPPPPKRDEVAELKEHYLAVRKRLRGEPKRLLPPVVTILPAYVPVTTAVERTPEQENLLREVCLKHKVSPRAVLGTSKKHQFTRARNEYIWLLRNNLGMSLREIGKLVGKSWSTVSDALDSHEKRVKEHA